MSTSLMIDKTQNFLMTHGWRRIFRNIVFISALLLTLCAGEALWLARIGWTLMALLYVVDSRYAIYAIFFYFAWFHSAGFLPKLIFTLKHFHLAIFLAFLASLLKNSSFGIIKLGLRSGRRLLYVAAIIFLGFVNGLRFGALDQAVRTPANLSLILTGLLFIMGLMEHWGQENPRILFTKCIHFYIFSVCVHVGLGFFNALEPQRAYLDLHLLHNNHIGILCAFSLFYPLSLFFTTQSKLARLLYFLSSVIIFSGLVSSCSRTAWLSCAAGAVLFFVLVARVRHITFKNILLRCGGPVFLMGAILLVLIALFNHPVYERVKGLPQLLDLEYWRYTLHDSNNFGFLGKFRLEQFFTLNNILSKHLILGRGFIRKVVDFHGFYFCLLGATGIVGLGLYMNFCRLVLKDLLNSLQSYPPLDMLKIGSLCAFVVWLCTSFTESYFVQFSAWLNPLMILMLVRFQPQLKKNSKTVQHART